MSLLRAYFDAEAEMYGRREQRMESFYMAAAAMMAGRKLWSWASLPGLGTLDGGAKSELYCWAWPGWAHGERDGWLTSRRVRR